MITQDYNGAHFDVVDGAEKSSAERKEHLRQRPNCHFGLAVRTRRRSPSFSVQLAISDSASAIAGDLSALNSNTAI
jgi:hypothetical protein